MIVHKYLIDLVQKYDQLEYSLYIDVYGNYCHYNYPSFICY